MKKRLVSWGLFGIMCLVLLTGCSTQARWQEQYDLGMRYLSESNYEEAILAFTEAIRINPEHADPYVYLIQGYLSAGQVEQAENIRLQGYEATGDTRLGQSVLDGSVFYDESIPFEERIFYRSFDLLSEDQQAELRQMIETLKAEDVEATQAFLSDGLTSLLCTMVDGWQVEIMCLQGEEYTSYYQSWLENEGEALTQKAFYRKSSINRMANGYLHQIRLTPENGTGYTCYCERVTFGASEEELAELEMTYYDITTTIQGLKQNECINWAEDGAMTAATDLEMIHSNDREVWSQGLKIETTGTAINGKSTTEKTRVVEESASGSLSVKEYDRGELTSWYMESPDGDREDMMEYLNDLRQYAQRQN